MIGHLPPYRVEAVAQSLPEGGVDWAVAAYGIPALWAKSRGAGVRVAVLDTGVCPGHPALEGRVAIHRNFTEDESPYDTNGHGTHVAGVIAAHGELHGVAPDCQIYSLKVLSNDGCGSMDSVARALHFASDLDCQIAVLSLGSPVGTARLESAVNAVTKRGMAVVCAAGNDGGRVSYPAAYGQTVAVGAVDRDRNVCPFSCRGWEVDVAAPGKHITSTWCHNGYATLSGTSMAAPFVAGVLALAQSQGAPGDAKQWIQSTSTDAGPVGKDTEYGWGLINPQAMRGET